MKNLNNFLISLVVLFPFISGLVRLRVMSRLYRPFLLLITLAVITEVVNYVLIHFYRQGNSIVINIYSLVESLLIIAQFYYWRLHSRTRRWYPYFGALCIIIWITENLLTGSVWEIGTIFRVSSAFVVVILSINEINYLLINDNKSLLKNSRFLICAGFLIYFLYQILLEGSFYITLKEDNAMAGRIIAFFVYINLLVNIIYGIAVWFIPKRTSLTFKDRIEH